MPLHGKGSIFKMVLYNCRGWSTLSDLIHSLEEIQDQYSILALKAKTIKEDGLEGRVPIEKEKFANYCETRYEKSYMHYKKFPREGAPIRRLYLFFRLPFISGDHGFVPMKEDKLVLMTAGEYPDGFNVINFSIVLSRRTDPKQILTKQYGEKVIQLNVSIGKMMIKSLKPDFLWIAEDDENIDPPGKEAVLGREIMALFWANYFAPGYLNQEKEQFFLSAPIGIVKRLEEGGIWYQLHERFENVDDEEAERIENEVKMHFEALNIDRIQWRFS